MKAILSIFPMLLLTTVILAPKSYAISPDESEMKYVTVLAKRLEVQTLQLYNSANQCNQDENYREDQAIERLEHLKNQAAWFRQEVERYKANPGHTAYDHEQLVISFQSAQNQMGQLNYDEEDSHNLNQVRQTMKEIKSYYQEGGASHTLERRSDDYILWQRASRLADQIEKLSSRAYRTALQNLYRIRFRNRDDRLRERKFLDRLNNFKNEADHFHRLFRGRRFLLATTNHEFRKLRRMLRVVMAEGRHSRLLRDIDRELRRIQGLVDRLESIYREDENTEIGEADLAVTDLQFSWENSLTIRETCDLQHIKATR